MELTVSPAFRVGLTYSGIHGFLHRWFLLLLVLASRTQRKDSRRGQLFLLVYMLQLTPQVDAVFNDNSGAEDAARRERIAKQIGLDKVAADVRHEETAGGEKGDKPNRRRFGDSDSEERSV